MWANYVEPQDEEVRPENEPSERKIDHKTVVVTEVANSLSFYTQDCEKGASTPEFFAHKWM